MNKLVDSPEPSARRGRTRSLGEHMASVPWWLLAAALLATFFFWSITTNENYNEIFVRVRSGVKITIQVTLVAYTLASVLGILIGLARTSSNPIIYQFVTFYVEIVRGVPMLVLLFYIAFVAGPQLVNLVNDAGDILVTENIVPDFGRALLGLRARDFSFMARAIFALTIGYSAFLSEVFRAGIQSVGKGQTEAARSLGMTYWQTMRYIILPQALKNVLPPLGNNLVAMLKDSSLVSVVGVRDITRLGDTYATSTFRFFEAFNVVAFLYLVMTIALSLVVRFVEKRLDTGRN